MINLPSFGEEEKRSISDKANSGAAQRHRSARNRMRVSASCCRQFKLTETDAGDRNEREHGSQGHGPEDNSDRHHETRTLLRGRVHEQRYQCFTRPEDENNKHHPGYE